MQMKQIKLFCLLLISGFWGGGSIAFALHSTEACTIADSNLNLSIGCIDVKGAKYHAALTFIKGQPGEKDRWAYMGEATKISDKGLSIDQINQCGTKDEQHNVHLACVNVNGTLYDAQLTPIALNTWTLSSADKLVTDGEFGAESTADCTPTLNPDWVTNPFLPLEIPNDGQTTCDFYEFGWRSYLYLMASNTDNPELRNFQVAADYPIYEPDGNSCDGNEAENPLKVTLTKLPQIETQAGGGAVLYDQNTNVVFYSVAFSQNLCDAARTATPEAANLPHNTLELKMSWKVLEAQDPDNFIEMTADIDGVGDDEHLGMLGFHLAYGTPLHPELVWASFEHKDNAPACLQTDPEDKLWTMTSSDSVACIMNPTDACLTASNFNKPSNGTNANPITGTPTNVCRVYPQGTAPIDFKGSENINNVTSMNNQAANLLPPPGSDNMLAVLSNYTNIGMLWVSDIKAPSGSPSGSSTNQRGALQLANSTMETTFQGTLKVVNNALTATPTNGNCLACHNYTPGSTAAPFTTSHIFSTIIANIKK
jgi:hypothetical protein